MRNCLFLHPTQSIFVRNWLLSIFNFIFLVLTVCSLSEITLCTFLKRRLQCLWFSLQIVLVTFLHEKSSFFHPSSFLWIPPLLHSVSLPYIFRYNPRLSAVMYSTFMSPLPPYSSFIYNLGTLYLGCKHVFDVIIIPVLQSMSWISSFVQSIIPALYFIIPIAQ